MHLNTYSYRYCNIARTTFTTNWAWKCWFQILRSSQMEWAVHTNKNQAGNSDTQKETDKNTQAADWETEVTCLLLASIKIWWYSNISLSQRLSKVPGQYHVRLAKPQVWASRIITGFRNNLPANTVALAAERSWVYTVARLHAGAVTRLHTNKHTFARIRTKTLLPDIFLWNETKALCWKLRRMLGFNVVVMENNLFHM